MNKTAFTRDIDIASARLSRRSDEMQPSMRYSDCWGAKLNGGVGCPTDFVPGKLHFKNNFCDNCRDGIIMVPLALVRALSAEQAACFVNKRSKGFWSQAPANLGGGQYRIVNNTVGCIGPWLAVFREQPPHLAWSAHARDHYNPNPDPGTNSKPFSRLHASAPVL